MPRARPRIININIWEDTALYLMARVHGFGGTTVNQASVNSIAVTVYDAISDTETYSGSLDVATTVFDTLQTSDTRWTQDTTGYNFAASIPASAFPSGGRQYIVEVAFTPMVGDVFYVVAQVLTDEILSS